MKTGPQLIRHRFLQLQPNDMLPETNQGHFGESSHSSHRYDVGQAGYDVGQADWSSIGLIGRSDLDNTELLDQGIGTGIMTLNHERPRFQTQAASRVLIAFAVV